MSGGYQSKVFGQYTLLDKIATGGMAEIFLARTRGFGGFEKHLVIKRLHPHYSDDTQFVKMLVDEARISVQLQHANIVQVFDLGRIGGQYYIAMELVEGQDLFHVLRELHQADLQMPVEAAAYIVAQLCHGLHYAHTRRDQHGDPLQVIHRDISPQNLLLSWNGEVKIADFGIVKARQRSTHTEAGVIKGKFYYMSPEQALGLDIDWRSDLFSAGIVLFEALTATPLYDDDNEAQLMQRVQAGDVRSPREFRTDLSPALEQICMKALATDRQDRYQSALEMSRDLSDFIVARGRSFTKVDLADFLAALYEDRAGSSLIMPMEEPPPTVPGERVARSVDDTLADEPLSLTPGGLSIADPTISDKPLPRPVIEPTATDVSARRAPSAPPPIPQLAQPAPANMSTAPVPHPAPAEMSTAPVPHTVEPDPRKPAAPPPKGPDVSDPQARTARLSKEEIERMNAAMLAARKSLDDPRGPGPARVIEVPPLPETTAPDLPPPGPPSGVELSNPALTPMPIRMERSRRNLRLQKRERMLKAALGVVGLAILIVAGAIIYVLMTPVKLPPLPEAESAVTTPRPRLVAPKPTPKRAAAPATPAALPDRGEYHRVRDGRVAIEPGAHSIQVELRPQGTRLPKRKVDLGPGSTHTIEL